MSIVRWTALLAVVIGAAFLSGCSTDSSQASGKSFLGSEKCDGCHTADLASWKDTYHSKMVRTPREGLLKDALDNWARDSKGNAGPTTANITGTPARLDDVVYVVGSKWKQRYLVKNSATGSHQFLDKQWNSYTKLWEPYGQKGDWETQCSTCHAGGYQITANDPGNNAMMKTQRSEHIAGCEACHGPGSPHISTRCKADIHEPANATKAADLRPAIYAQQQK